VFPSSRPPGQPLAAHDESDVEDDESDAVHDESDVEHDESDVEVDSGRRGDQVAQSGSRQEGLDAARMEHS
jgi:hypothetical protein